MALTKVIGNGLGTLGDGTANDTKIVFDGNAQDYYIGLDDSADSLVLGYGSTVGSTQILRATTSEISFNDDSADVDFRVESNGATHMLFVQAGADCLGIKTTSPNDYYADDLVLTAPDEGGITIVQGTGHRGYLAFADGTSGSQAYRGYISYDHNDDTLYLGTDGGGKLLIDTTGAVTKPSQPAFMARPSSSQTSIASDDTIAFGTEVFDQNADFSSNTFTAPITGKYQLDVTVRAGTLDTAANYVRLFLTTSNRNYETIFDFGGLSGDPSFWTFNINVLADMDANDTAFVKWSQSGGASQASIGTVEASFSGYLVA